MKIIKPLIFFLNPSLTITNMRLLFIGAIWWLTPMIKDKFPMIANSAQKTQI